MLSFGLTTSDKEKSFKTLAPGVVDVFNLLLLVFLTV
jgi:hypothetical protein